MILSKKIIVKISNQGKYYSDLGYLDIKQGNIISVKISDLPPNSNKKILCKCDECEDEFERQFQLINRSSIHFCYSCSRKHIGKTMNRTNIDLASKKRNGSNHPRWVENKEAFLKYARKVRSLTENVYKNNIDLINPQGYKRTLCGVENGWQLDHMMSIKTGFNNNVPATEIASVDNLQMLPWRLNRTKGDSLWHST